jgi:hypothetical protein
MDKGLGRWPSLIKYISLGKEKMGEGGFLKVKGPL